MDSAGIALVFSSVSLAISYLTYKSNRYKIYVGKRFDDDFPAYSTFILCWVTNCGKRPVTVKGFYAEYIGSQPGFSTALFADISNPKGFVSLDFRLEEADTREIKIWEGELDGQSPSLEDVRVTVIDACGKRYEAKDPSGTWKQRFRRSRSVRWLTSQLRSLLRINKG